ADPLLPSANLCGGGPLSTHCGHQVLACFGSVSVRNQPL
ncbi:MAG: hypothetical protein AVDCRST_MAG39-1647, partial [uncultured Sphingomonadaceae bacterium]